MKAQIAKCLPGVTMSIVQRLAACVQYDGSAYHGFQLQDNQLDTIQLRLEKAISQVANHPVAVICAGRTDAGVHAWAQIIHFDVKVERDNRSWLFGINANLPRDISIRWVKPVSAQFHARYEATLRHYCYLIYNAPVRQAIMRQGVTWHYRPLDANSMQEAANILVGKHDFSAFRGANCQAKSPIRTVKSLNVTRHNDYLVLEIKANAFLHHMVRNIVGTLYQVGGGLRSVSWIKEVLESKDRRNAGVTAMPYGLYLTGVSYAAHWQLPEISVNPFFITFH